MTAEVSEFPRPSPFDGLRRRVDDLRRLVAPLTRVPPKTWLIVVGSIVGAIALGAGLLRTPLFAIERIDVIGNAQVSREATLSLSGLKLGEFLVSVDEGAIEHKLEADPWVESATVKSDWPHVVKVKISERKAVAIAQAEGGKWVQLSPGGVVLAVDDKPTVDLPTVLGFQVSAEPGTRLSGDGASLISVSELMPESLRKQVLQMDRNATDGIRLGLDNGVVVIVGDESDLGAKLTSASAIVAREDLKDAATLDVRSHQMPLVTPKVKPQSQTEQKQTTNSSTSTGTATQTKPSTKPSTTSTTTKQKVQ